MRCCPFPDMTEDTEQDESKAIDAAGERRILLEANENLVFGLLRAQSDAEAAVYV